ncbi:MAG TPA: SGNH/GDSL hydrolase family protein [Trichocoleus sp.]
MVKRRFVLAGLVGITAMMLPLISNSQISNPQPQPVRQLYVFGDSLSDTGVAFRFSGGQYPPNPPYFQGRFSNGRVWTEYLAEDLQVPVDQVRNFACGGATTGTAGNSLAPSLLVQVSSFLQAQSAVSPDALYVIWAGANDYLQGASSATAPVENIRSAIASLIQKGARRILVANLPNLGQLPSIRSSSQAKALEALSQAHNQGLRRTLKLLNQQFPDVQIATLDAGTLYQEANANPSKFGFSNATSACLQGVRICGQPNQFLFWDDIHPTTAAHRVLASSALQALQDVRIAQTSTGAVA